MRLIFAVRQLNEPKMFAVVEDDQGHRRRISLLWLAREGADAPVPVHWVNQVKEEVEAARARDERPPTNLAEVLERAKE